MKSLNIYVLLKWEHDGGEPILLRAYKDKTQAELDRAMIDNASYYGNLAVREVPYFYED